MYKKLLFITVFFMNAFLVAAQEAPGPRNQPAVAFDSKRGRLVLFGGIDQSGKSLNDTWEWDGKSWARRTPAASPAARAATALVYDAKRERIVLFGGQVGAGSLADTWEYDGNDWTKIATAATPPERVAHALVFYPSRGRIVLFGGTDFKSRRTFNDTWEYDGKNWTELKPANAPEGRFHHALAFDAKRKQLVLFGGNAAVPPLDSEKFKAGQRNDTWIFDGRDWRAAAAPGAPPKRDHHALAFDFGTKKVVLFGGFAGGFTDGTYLGDTWTWDGKRWRELTLKQSPAARAGKPGMAADEKARRLILFGGGSPQKALNDLWFFKAENWGQ
jgi:hypothetical protein